MTGGADGGYALITVLVLAFVLGILLNVIFQNHYQLHRQNKRFAQELQARAEKLGAFPGRE